MKDGKLNNIISPGASTESSHNLCKIIPYPKTANIPPTIEDNNDGISAIERCLDSDFNVTKKKAS